MRFEEAYTGWQEGRLTQVEAARLSAPRRAASTARNATSTRWLRWPCCRWVYNCASHIAEHRRNLGLGFKLLLAPLVIYLLYVPLFGAHGLAIQVTLFEAAMPPMITAAIIASEHDLDPELATLMVAVGLLVSFATLSGWWWVLQGV